MRGVWGNPSGFESRAAHHFTRSEPGRADFEQNPGQRATRQHTSIAGERQSKCPAPRAGGGESLADQAHKGAVQAAREEFEPLVCMPGEGFDPFIQEASEPATAPGLP